MLETGGMINITAKSAGKPLMMKDGQEYALYFPKNEVKGEMQLFYGDRDTNGQMNWTPANREETASESTDSEFDLNGEMLYRCKMEIVGHTIKIGPDTVFWNLKNERQTLQEYFSRVFNAPEDIASEFCSNNYSIRVGININNAGKISEVNFNDSCSVKSKKVLTNFLKNAPALDLKGMAYYSPGITYTLHFGVNTYFEKDVYPEKFREKYATFKDKAITKINQAELNYYVQTATRFGWINCDRFWDSPDETIEFLVNVPSPEKTRVFLLFKEINSLLQGDFQGGKIVFENIPINKRIKIIAISYKEGTPSLGIAETTIGKGEFVLNDFNSFSLKDLERELNEY